MKLDGDYSLTSVDFDKPNKFALTKRKMKDMRITLEKKMRRGQHIVKPPYCYKGPGATGSVCKLGRSRSVFFITLPPGNFSPFLSFCAYF